MSLAKDYEFHEKLIKKLYRSFDLERTLEMQNLHSEIDELRKENELLKKEKQQNIEKVIDKMKQLDSCRGS